jgi:diadenylate cyclase
MTLGVLAILIVFQPELRGALERIGRSRFGELFNFEDNNNKEKIRKVIDEVVLAVENLSKTSTGALMAFERETKLGDICNTGTILDAEVTSELIENIFFVNTPLHDGAAIISEGRIKAAGCFLPLSENRNISHELGTRHRAGIGISENSDAIVVIVSEETGRISIACEGVLTRNLVPDTLRKALLKALLTEEEVKEPMSIWKGRNIWKRIE